jgi:flagellar biogenesis protein FliO
MELVEQLLAAATVFTLLAGLLWWLRRRGIAQFTVGLASARARRRLELIERLPLTPQHSLHLVRVGSRAILIGRSPSGLTLLHSPEWGLEQSPHPTDAAEQARAHTRKAVQ